MRTRTFVLVGLLVALVIAGFGSYYASSRPDGLNRVAQQHGFSAQEQESATADSPLAGYSTDGVHDQRLSVGLAGVAGCAVVLLVGGGLFWLLRRRGPSADRTET